MKLGILSGIGALSLAAVTVTAPAVSAFPTGSAGGGDGRQVVIVDNTLELSDLDACWASGFPRDIHFDNRSSRNFLVYATKDCTGEPTATVAAGTSATFNGWSATAAR